MSEDPNTAQAPSPEIPDVYVHAPSRVAFAEAYGSAERIPFRSTLEARWARLFTRLGLAWQYEPYTFSLPTGRRYTPDFRVEVDAGDGSPSVLWVEVKPVSDALLAIEHRLYAFARYLREHQPTARIVSLAMDRPGHWRTAMGVLEWFPDGVRELDRNASQRLFMSATARELHEANPEHFGDYLDRMVRGAMEDEHTATLGEHLFTSAVTNGADFDAMRVAYFAHDPHSRFTFAQAWRPPQETD